MSTPESHDPVGADAHDAHDAHGHGEPVRAEPDLVPVAPVIVGIGVIIVIFLVGIFWSYRIQRHQEAITGVAEDSAPKPPHAFQYEVGLVNQKQFEQEHRAYDLQGQQKADLSGYGWTDKEKKLAHVPVEEGAKKFISEQQGGQK